jgi:ADP-heptose:LPS heptosyltransferase
VRVFRGKEKPQELYAIFNYGGLGDNIARLPAVRTINEEYPHIELTIFVPDYFVELAKHLMKDHPMKFVGFSDQSKVAKKGTPITDTTWTIHSSLRTGLVDHAFHTLLDQPVKRNQYLYPELRPEEIDYEIPVKGKYVVIPVNYTAPAREFKPEVVNKVVSWLKDSSYTPVFLGKSFADLGNKTEIHKLNQKVNLKEGANLIDKTSLLETAKIIHGAEAIVGMDCGLLHLAGCTSTPIVGGYNIVAPELRIPYRKNGIWITITPDVECKFCQERMNFVYNHSFKRCYFKDYRCLEDMNAKAFIDALDIALHGEEKV